MLSALSGDVAAELSAIVPLLALMVASFFLARPLRDRYFLQSSRWVVFALCASLALVISVTLLRDVPAFVDIVFRSAPQGSHFPGSPFEWSANGWQRLTYSTIDSSQIILNVALFVPAGFFAALALKRTWSVFACLIGLSLLIECVQAVTFVGTADVADLCANSAGALLGAVAGSVSAGVAAGVRTRQARVAARDAFVLAGVVVSVAGAAFVGAHHRQVVLERRLAQTFHGTSVVTLQKWTASNELEVHAFDVGGVRMDGMRYEPSVVLGRFPASFLGVSRCVFVRWDSAGAAIEPGKGAACTRFFG